MKPARWGFLPLAIATTLLLGCLLAWPASQWGGTAALASALGVGLAGAVLGDWTRRAVAKRLDDLAGRGQAMLAGMTARMLATLAGAVVVILLGRFAPLRFGVWLGSQYVLLLGLEVFVTVRELRQNPAGSAEGSPQGEVESPGENAKD